MINLVQGSLQTFLKMNKSLLSKYIENLCVLTSDYKQNETFLSISVILKKNCFAGPVQNCARCKSPDSSKSWQASKNEWKHSW